jgi:hypothetical protein
MCEKGSNDQYNRFFFPQLRSGVDWNLLMLKLTPNQIKPMVKKKIYIYIYNRFFFRKGNFLIYKEGYIYEWSLHQSKGPLLKTIKVDKIRTPFTNREESSKTNLFWLGLNWKIKPSMGTMKDFIFCVSKVETLPLSWWY